MTTTTKTREITFALRPEGIADEDFLLLLYVQERAAELESFGLDALQRKLFVQMQFRARQLSYATHHPTASGQIVVLECGTPIGRFLVERTEEEIRLVDIALISEQQGRGIGTKLVRTLQTECQARDGKLRLQVLKGTKAERFYRQLGFVGVGEDSFRIQMVWAGRLQHLQEAVSKRQIC